jgi:clan AA aspartic protease
MFKVNVTAVNPRNPDQTSAAIEVLVDTGSELTWMPKDVLQQTGIQPVRKRSFQTATKDIIQRDIGYAILRSEGFETNDEVVFAEPGDMNLLGVRTLEGFGVAVDNIGHRFVAQATLVV